MNTLYIVCSPTPSQMQQKLKVGDVCIYSKSGVSFELIEDYTDGDASFLKR